MLILICGVGRAGKTTYSRFFNNVIHLDKCGLPYKRYENVNNILKKIKTDVVVEGVYERKILRKNLLNSYFNKDTKICIWLNTPEDIIKERLKKIYVPFIKQHMNFDSPTLDQGWDQIVIIQQNKKKVLKAK